MSAYIALIRKEEGTSYGVNFPDFPGLVSGGETLDEALARAREGLEFHLDGMIEAGQPVPAPSSLEAIVADPENAGAVAVVIQGPTPRGKSVRVNLTFDERLLAEVDAAVGGGLAASRSGYFAEAARERLSRGAPVVGGWAAPSPKAKGLRRVAVAGEVVAERVVMADSRTAAERIARERAAKPRELGTNPRATGKNPRALGTNPRTTGKPRA